MVSRKPHGRDNLKASLTYDTSESRTYSVAEGRVLAHTTPSPSRSFDCAHRNVHNMTEPRVDASHSLPYETLCRAKLVEQRRPLCRKPVHYCTLAEFRIVC